ncbi:MAG: molybdopterin-binding protein [Candidatus Bathyarchaeota archaeon]|jgi:putative molybdopterin biosynthesis protein|nr:molybdopterin-binding protein [Candidatus Bathyarchaeota archaeon]
MFRELMPFDLAKKLIIDTIDPKPLGEEQIPLIDATNRIISKDVISNMDIPPFSRSTVDGYAVKAEDTYGAEENKPVNLNITGEVSVGEYPELELKKGETVEIVTGAPIPKGANAVVMVENTQKKENTLLIYRAVTQEENVMKRGTDIKRGDTVLNAGQFLGASEIGVLAAIGMNYIKVQRTPIVAVISTGAEITEPGKKLTPGKIYDINAYSLSAAVLKSGGKPVYMGVIPDNEIALNKALKQALDSSDMIITSGGVSVGPRDYTPKIVNSLGKPGVIISGIAVKPGKPTTVALIGKKPVFSLPGHPTSALLIFYLLVKPIIESLVGEKVLLENTVKANLTTRLFSAKGRKTFVTVKLSRDKNQRLIADPIQTGASGAITTLSKADGFIEIPANQQFIDSNEIVKVTLLRSKKI